MSRITFLILAFWGVVIPLQAQDGQAPPKKRSVRFLAVGDFPPFRQEVRNGVRYELPPPPGSVPPADVRVAPEVAKPEAETAKAASVRLKLGTASGPLPVPAGEGVLLVRAAGNGGGEPWLRVPQPESGDFLVVVWRGTKAQTWDKPKFMVIPDTHPAGKLTLVNVAPVPVAVICGAEKILVEPGKPHICDLAGGKPVEFHVGTPTAGNGFKKMISMSLEQRQKEHTLAVLCLSDGVEPRQPLKLTLLKNRVQP